MNKKSIKKTSVSIDEDVYDKIKDLAQTERRNFSQMVEFILVNYLEQIEQSNKKIKK